MPFPDIVFWSKKCEPLSVIDLQLPHENLQNTLGPSRFGIRFAVRLSRGLVLDHQSVTVWLKQLKQGDQSAAKKLWDRYEPTLVRLARQQYRSCTSPVFDEEDLIQCVFTALWTAATSGQLEKVEGRDDLWWLLLAITRRKAINRAAYNVRQKRNHGIGTSLRCESNLEDDSSAVQSLVCDPDQPPPDLIMVLEEEQQRLLELLRDDTLRSIALLKFEGYDHEEIASRLSVTPRTIVRKVELIRKRWARELEL